MPGPHIRSPVPGLHPPPPAPQYLLLLLPTTPVCTPLPRLFVLCAISVASLYLRQMDGDPERRAGALSVGSAAGCARLSDVSASHVTARDPCSGAT
eukprot:368242-Rhodomonas_salina.2